MAAPIATMCAVPDFGDCERAREALSVRLCADWCPAARTEVPIAGVSGDRCARVIKGDLGNCGAQNATRSGGRARRDDEGVRLRASLKGKPNCKQAYLHEAPAMAAHRGEVGRPAPPCATVAEWGTGGSARRGPRDRRPLAAASSLLQEHDHASPLV